MIGNQIADWSDADDDLFAIVEASAKSGHIEQALVLAKHIQRWDVKQRCFFRIAEAMNESGNHASARLMFERAHLVKPTSERTAFKAMLLIGVANSMMRTSEPAQVHEVLNHALSLGNQLTDRYLKTDILDSVAKGLIELGLYEEATPLLDQALQTVWRENFQSWVWKPSKLSDIATLLSRMGDHERALYVARRITPECSYSDYWSSRALAKIAKEMSRKGQEEGALAILDEALKLANECTERRKGPALAYMGKILIEFGKKKQGLALFDQAILSMDKTRGKGDRKANRAKIAELLAQAGDPGRATVLMNQLEGSFGVSAIIEIAKAWTRSGNLERADLVLDDAIKLAEQITNEYEKVTIFARIAKMQIKSARVDNVKRLILSISHIPYASYIFMEVLEQLYPGEVHSWLDVVNKSYTPDNQ